MVIAGRTERAERPSGISRHRLRLPAGLGAAVLIGSLAGALLGGGMLGDGLITELEPPQTTTAVRPLRIMAMGDSITSGTGSVARDAYRGDLYARLTGAGLEVDFVGSQRSGLGVDGDHEGHGGATIARIAERADGWLATYEPDVILLHVGTNNITRGDSARTASRRLSDLIDQLRARRPATYLFVSQIVGSNVPVERLVDRMFNARLAAIVATKGPMVRLVDQSTVSGTDLYDLHHPNDIGYAKMSFNFYRAMEQVLNDSGKPWPPGVNPYRANSAPRCVPARPASCALARGTERRLPVR